MCHPKLAVSLRFPLRYCSWDRDSWEVSRGASIEHHMHRCGVTAEVPRMMSYVTYSRLPLASQVPTTPTPYKTNCQHIFFIPFSVIYEGPFL